MPFNARKVALETLNTLDQGRRTLDNILEGIPVENASALKRDHALLPQEPLWGGEIIRILDNGKLQGSL